MVLLANGVAYLILQSAHYFNAGKQLAAAGGGEKATSKGDCRLCCTR